jgi:hypothetical protein
VSHDAVQLGSEEVEQSLTEVSAAALRRVPFAQQEVSRLKQDVAALQVSAQAQRQAVRVGGTACLLHSRRCHGSNKMWQRCR